MALQKHQLGYVEGILSAVVNTALFACKIWVGNQSGSVSIIADAWHTLSDTLTSLIVIFGFWMARRPGDKEHPFGHGRAEIIGAVVIGTLLAVVGVMFFRDSIQQLRAHTAALFSTSAIVVFSVSVIAKEGVAQFSLRAGRRVGSQSLIADGWHHRSDAIASGLILLGVLFGRSLWWIDGVLGIGVSLLILYAAYQVIRDSANTLMGEAPDRWTVNRIRELVASHAPEVADVHHVHVHRYGDHAEVTLHAKMPADHSIAWSHEVASSVEQLIRKHLDMEATVHVEPGD